LPPPLAEMLIDILVVEPLPAEVLRWLGARHRVRVEPELAREPIGFRAALATTRAAIVPPAVMVDAGVLWHAPHLKVLGRVSAGQENIDLEACTRAGIEVARAQGAGATAEAEFVVGALLALLRRVPIISDEGLLVGRELGSSTVGIVGLTPAAECLAQLLGNFGAKVLGYDMAVHASEAAWGQAGIRPVPLAELVHSSDSVCLLMSWFPRHDRLFGERLLQFAKPHQVIVSLTHSRIFDEQALAHALRHGPIAAAWIDSLEPGALDPGKPLQHIDTLQVTPRVASTTRESRLRSAWTVAQRIDQLLRAGAARQTLREPGAGDSPQGPPTETAGPAGATEPA
jgi:D-3-phosphoglycerate dehydrogenase / 2-oxoglutarate reductase